MDILVAVIVFLILAIAIVSYALCVPCKMADEEEEFDEEWS